MRTRLLFLMTTLISVKVFSQASILKGIVYNEKLERIAGATIYIKDSSLGTNSDKEGIYSIDIQNLDTNNKITIVCSFIGYSTQSIDILLKDINTLDFTLLSKSYSLDEVIVYANSFRIGHEGKVSVLSPLDVKTTPNALGDILGVMQNMPGVQNIRGDGRLYVRGGDFNESKFFINGLEIPSPYTKAPESTSVRSKYSPDLFGGIALNTGGYSTEYGESMSGGLFLESKEFDLYKNKIDLSVTSVGGWIENAIKKEKNALYLSANYTDLTPYKGLIPDNVKWEKDYRQVSLNIFDHYITQKEGEGCIKTFVNFNHIGFEIPDYGLTLNPLNNKVNEDDFYSSISSNTSVGNSSSIYVGSAFSYNKSRVLGINFEDDLLVRENTQFQLKSVFSKKKSHRFIFKIGSEFFLKNNNEDYSSNKYKLHSNLYSGFTEIGYVPFKNFGIQFGLRGEHSSLLNNNNVSPRISFNYKIDNHILSSSIGQYSQIPENKFLINNYNLTFQKSNNYILNYSYNKDNASFRVELYYKDYRNLIRYSTEQTINKFDNAEPTGSGFAQGVDVFFKNQINKFKYWVTYSYIDSKRDYLNYTQKEIPTFIAHHNISFVGKYWAAKIKSQIGVSLNYNSGRYYENPNLLGINESKLKPFFDMTFNWAYIMKPNIILYSSLSNVTGYQYINDYNYSVIPNSSGFFESMERKPLSNRFFFIGIFITLSTDKMDNQLDKL